MILVNKQRELNARAFANLTKLIMKKVKYDEIQHSTLLPFFKDRADLVL